MKPGVFEGMGERKIFFNNEAQKAIQAGAEQVLVLGAGFDTLCLRLAPQYDRVRFFEVDHPATSAVKANGVGRVGKPANMTLLPADLAEIPLTQVMSDCGNWNPQALSFVVAEGLLMYLAPGDVRTLFREVASCTGAGSRVVFSHIPSLAGHGFTQTMLKLVGEPWLSASTTESLPDYIGPGWQVIASREARPGRDIEGFAVVRLEEKRTGS